MWLIAACAAGQDSTVSNSGLSSQGGSNPSGTGGTGGTGSAETDAASSTVDLTGGGVDASTAAATSITSGGDDETTADPVPNPDGLPNGEECTDPAQCMTLNCYKIPLPVDGLPPGLCSVCDKDMDCVDAGLGTACTVDAVTLAAKCTYGDLGSFCESEAACQKDLFCAQLIPGSDGFLPHTCSECNLDTDCGGGLRCLPVIDVAKYSGMKHCTVQGTVNPGGLCPLPDGDAMCLTGKCALLNIAGIFDVGVCGQCKADTDCPGSPMMKCDPPKFNDGFVASTCI